MYPLANRCNMEDINYTIVDPRALTESTTTRLINPLAVKHLGIDMGWVLRKGTGLNTIRVSGKNRVMRRAQGVTVP